MERIMIIGCSGAGKSTLAKKLGNLLGLELIHLDRHFWLPDWTEPDTATWEEKVAKLADREQWIIDGNYGGTMDLRLNRADTVIFLDYSTWICLSRVVKRTLRYWKRERPDMPKGCRERFNWNFLRYVYSFNTRKRPRLIAKLSRLPLEQRLYRLQSDEEVRIFLRQLSEGYH